VSGKIEIKKTESGKIGIKKTAHAGLFFYGGKIKEKL